MRTFVLKYTAYIPIYTTYIHIYYMNAISLCIIHIFLHSPNPCI